jgi:HAE1 family hydrophobic/amphiphilic exporter-1
MDMVKKRLDSKHGIMLIAPPYTAYDPKIGAVGTFAPGLKENGGIFCHANPWGMIAETKLGRGDQAFEYTAFVNGRLSSEKEFGDIIVKTQPENGSLVHLRDVARVELGKFNYSGSSYVDGKRTSFLIIFQSPGSNALETFSGIITEMQNLKNSFPADVDYSIPFETASVVQVSIREVVKTLLIALLLVLLVVYLFLQNWRATIIPILAIPVSIIGTFIFFLPLGFTINTLTLFALVLAIGIVVDDAIIVVEAVQHYIDDMKMSPKDAAFHAMKDISGPVVPLH